MLAWILVLPGHRIILGTARRPRAATAARQADDVEKERADEGDREATGATPSLAVLNAKIKIPEFGPESAQNLRFP